ncbi:MAG TPA: hypothetical protein VJ765_12135 [Chitinophagaceae bacterium]|nr:hypothetical protein [Chitinophagaceae bacterium]
MPKLISHYFEHRQSNPEISFFDFLAMHYGGDDGTMADNDIDNQLPYHHVDHHCLFGTFWPMSDNTFQMDLPEYNITEYGGGLTIVHPSEYISFILHPPRTI